MRTINKVRDQDFIDQRRLTGEDSRQTVSVWDVIAEGPIEGLVDGNASVFFDNDPIVDKNTVTFDSSAHVTKNPSFGSTIAFTNGSKNGTVQVTADLSNIAERTLWVDKVVTLTGVTGTLNSETLTVSGGTTTDIVNNRADLPVDNILRIINGHPNGVDDLFYTVSERVSSTSIKLSRPLIHAVSNTTAELIYLVKVASVSGTSTLVLENNWPWATGTYDLTLGSQFVINPTSSSAATSTGDTKKVNRSTLQFRTGSLVQEPIRQIGSLQGSSVTRTTGLNRTLDLAAGYYQLYPSNTRSNEQSEFTETQGSDTAYVINSVSDLGLTNSKEVDEIVLSFEYSSLFAQRIEKGDTSAGYSAFLPIFSFSRDGTNYTDVTLPIIEHVYTALQGFTVDYNINLEPFQPFDRWKISIKRITAATGLPYSVGTWKGKPLSQYDSGGKRKDKGPAPYKFRQQAACKLSTITSIIKHKLTYPHTAYAAVTFDSKTYPNMPVRSYHIRGKKVKVPANYVTREEASDGIAAYTRDSDGDVQSSYQDWDGTFRTNVYTNNPAWVLYDLLHSKRYGMGRFVDSVDKWSFYRVGRYCDELVPNGKGGQEPRYTCNLVLQKGEAARKVLADLATNFLGLLHWLDGEMYLTADQPSAPLYTFGRGNVIDGDFVYSSTEFKQRPNQYVVIWNNPDLDFKQDFVLVEDTENILDRGVVISKETFAFGCTSRSQAERYGRWRLFTDRLQTDNLIFNTSINASFLNPGDLIAVQDANLESAELAGRIASSGTVSTTVVALDRNIVLEANVSYTLNVLFFSPAAILVDDSATINSVAYTKGDIILTDNSGSALTETSVNNLKDTADSNRPVNVIWRPDTHVQSRAVSTSAGTVNSLTVSTAFSATPTRETMWTLTAKSNNIVNAASSKEFLVTNVSQTEDLVWQITAVEHFNSKFTSVESSFNLTVQDTDFEGPSSTDLIPSIANLTLAFSNA